MGRTAKPAARGGKTTARSKKAQEMDTRRDFAFILMIGLAALTLFIACIRPDEYSSLYTLKQTVSGLVGSMGWTLPIMFAWAGVLAYRSNGQKNQLAKMFLLIFLFELCLLSAVEAFSCERIARRMRISGYINFLSMAWKEHAGGGLLGALFSRPIQSLIGQWGTLLIAIVCAVLLLISMRLVSLRRLSEKVSEMRSARPPREKEASAPTKEVRPFVKKPSAAEKKPSAEPVFVRKSGRSVSRRGDSLFVDDISEGSVDTGAPIRIPKLSRDGMPPRVTPVRAPGNEETIPEVNPTREDGYGASAYAERPARKPSSRAKKPVVEPVAEPAPEKPEIKIEKIDLMEAVRNETAEKRNSDYVKNALGDHSRKPKPVLTYRLNDDAEEKAPQAKPERKEKKLTADELFTVGESVRARAAATEAPAKRGAASFDPDVSPAPRASRSAPRVEEKEVKPEPKKRVPAEPQPSYFEKDYRSTPKPEHIPAAKLPDMKNLPVDDEYDFPPIDLMEAGEPVEKNASGYDAEDMKRAETLIRTLQSFSIPVKLTGVSHGPAVTRFEFLPAPGIKVSRISSYADDIAMALAAVSVRIEAPIPGKSAVGVEVPNVKKEVVHLRDVLESPEARKAASRLAVGLGKDNSGKYIVADLASMPHVLIAGQTGSGKSVCINAIIISILYRATPDEVKMILIDPKMVELNAYNTIPHLLVPVVTDPKKAASALDWAVAEMTRRYKTFAEHGAKNIQSYNQKLPPDEKPMPQIVLIVDELADLMMTAPRDVEEAINRLAQLARAAGIHLVIATQRPSVDIITGVIKANIPTRIAFTVASGVDSRTILDSYGAEKLLGRGDMLYLPSDRNKPLRIQGAWVSESEVQAVVDYISNTQSVQFDEEILEHMENAVLSDAEKNDKNKDQEENTVDELFAVAVKYVVDAGQASISMLQRKLRVGYARAGRLIDEMAARGLVSQSEGSKSREVLITREQYRELFGEDGEDDIDAE